MLYFSLSASIATFDYLIIDYFYLLSFQYFFFNFTADDISALCVDFSGAGGERHLLRWAGEPDHVDVRAVRCQQSARLSVPLSGSSAPPYGHRGGVSLAPCVLAHLMAVVFTGDAVIKDFLFLFISKITMHKMKIKLHHSNACCIFQRQLFLRSRRLPVWKRHSEGHVAGHVPRRHGPGHVQRVAARAASDAVLPVQPRHR